MKQSASGSLAHAMLEVFQLSDADYLYVDGIDDDSLPLSGVTEDQFAWICFWGSKTLSVEKNGYRSLNKYSVPNTVPFAAILMIHDLLPPSGAPNFCHVLILAPLIEVVLER